MSKQMVIHGVPDRIRLDGWWLGSAEIAPREGTPARNDTTSRVPTLRRPQAILVLGALVLLADWLFWGHAPGLSVALFALALSAGILLTRPGGTSRREWGIALGFEILCNLPVIEQLQALSLLFTGLGITGLVVWVAYGRIVDWWQGLWAMIRVSTVGIDLLISGVAIEIRGLESTQGLRHHLRALILPLGIGAVFAVLLISANPILEQALETLSQFEVLTTTHLLRSLFWLVAAIFIWPYLNLRGAWLGPVAEIRSAKTGGAPWLVSLVTVPSVRTSLVLFNLLFLVQTATDVGVLLGEVPLPENMSLARYAHRGAYPLVVTALLAGVFAMATHKMTRDSRFLRNLLFLWLGQNLFLVITAAYRLGIYVKAYNLTHLRVAAFIWMGLVFVGLILTLVQITHGKRISWLVRSNLAVLMGTLYLCSLVNFTAIIAGYNLRNAETVDWSDIRYVCRLGEQALPALYDLKWNRWRTTCADYNGVIPLHSPIDNWRDWGFREWRLQVYLAKTL